MVTICSLDDPRIAEYRFLPGRTGRLLPGERTIVESEVVALRLLRYPWSEGLVESALLEPSAAERLAATLEARGIPPERIYVAPKSLLEQVVGYHLHHGVFLCMRVPPQVPLEQLPLPAVMLVGVNSATNLGAIARSCAGLGFRSLICDRACASPWLRRCIRVSMGAIFALANYHATEETLVLIERLRERGGRLVGVEVGAPLVYSTFEWTRNDILIFGSEGAGLDAAFLEQLDAAVHIPMSATIDSLNVAAAAAIVLAECSYRCGLIAKSKQ